MDVLKAFSKYFYKLFMKKENGVNFFSKIVY